MANAIDIPEWDGIPRLDKFLELWKYELAEMCHFTKHPCVACTGPAAGRGAAVSIVVVAALLPLAFLVHRRIALASPIAGQLPARRQGAARAVASLLWMSVPGWLRSGLCAVFLRKP